MDNQIQTITGIILEEQEWIPGMRAPFLFWVTMVGATGYLALGTLWLYHHNKKLRQQENI